MQRLRVAVRDRQHGNLREDGRFVDRRAPGARHGADADRQRVARRAAQVFHRSALHAVARPHRAVRKHGPQRKPVVFRVGVDQAAGRAVFGRDLRLDAAEDLPVAHQDNRAARRNAHALELLVVLDASVVGVHERRRDVAVDRIGVVRRQLFRLLAARRVHRHDRLVQLRPEPRRLDQLQHAFLRRGEEHVELLDRGVPAPLLEPRQHPLGVVLRVRRSHVMRPGAQPLHVAADVGGLRDGAEPFVRRLRRRRLRADEHGGAAEHGTDCRQRGWFAWQEFLHLPRDDASDVSTSWRHGPRI